MDLEDRSERHYQQGGIHSVLLHLLPQIAVQLFIRPEGRAEQVFGAGGHFLVRID